MDDVERLFKLAVNVLADQAPARLRGPIQLADLYVKVIPYKACKTVLRFDTHQDYEMAMLKLLAGERDYVSVEPSEAQVAMLREAEAVNPNPGAFRQYAASRVTFSQTAVRRVLEEREGGGYAPQQPEAPSQEPEEAVTPPAPATVAARCPHCFEAMPTGRPVVFCPFCGKNVKAIECPQCGSQMEPGWRYCITCGQDMNRQ
jgi:hypothetical protein